MQRQLWRFYWPLVLTGLAMLLAQQFQNGALARYPRAARELAVFAFASSIFGMFNAALIFIPQMANVLARSARSQRSCLRFTVGTGLVIALPLAFLAYTPQGRGICGGIFNIGGGRLDDVILYLRFLLPLVPVQGLRQHFTGMLVQAKRTKTVTALNAVYLASAVFIVVYGFHSGWRPVVTISLSRLVPTTFHCLLLWFFKRRLYRLPDRSHRSTPTYREIFSFFWPASFTSIMFAFSRPIIYSFVSRVPDGETDVAAMRVGFVLAMIFHGGVNQFRHLFATYGGENLVEVRRFIVRIAALTTLIMAAVVFSPVSTLILSRFLGVEGEILLLSRQVLMVMCLIPVIIATRNYFHGLSMVQRSTYPMGIGAISRTVSVYLVTWALFSLGRLNHVTGAAALMAGFAAEAAGVVLGRTLFTNGRRRDAGSGG